MDPASQARVWCWFICGLTPSLALPVPSYSRCVASTGAKAHNGACCRLQTALKVVGPKYARIISASRSLRSISRYSSSKKAGPRTFSGFSATCGGGHALPVTRADDHGHCITGASLVLVHLRLDAFSCAVCAILQSMCCIYRSQSSQWRLLQAADCSEGGGPEVCTHHFCMPVSTLDLEVF